MTSQAYNSKLVERLPEEIEKTARFLEAMQSTNQMINLSEEEYLRRINALIGRKELLESKLEEAKLALSQLEANTQG
jgi:uncharacterized coiled-coil DUF342 family protein